MARNKTDDSYVTGTALRKILGIPLGDMKGKFKIDLSKIPDFDVFVQSTSYNRQLMPGKFFLSIKIIREIRGKSNTEYAKTLTAYYRLREGNVFKASVNLLTGEKGISWSVVPCPYWGSRVQVNPYPWKDQPPLKD